MPGDAASVVTMYGGHLVPYLVVAFQVGACLVVACLVVAISGLGMIDGAL